MIASCSVWARIRVTCIPIDHGRKSEAIEVGVKVCSVPDPEDAIGSWSVELHTESAAPASAGVGKDPGLDQTNAVPKATFYAELAFNSAAVLTHIKGRCATLKGERFMKAVKLPDALTFMPGDHARVEINIYKDSDTQIPPPSVEVFQEPEPKLKQELGRPAMSHSFSLGSSRVRPPRGIQTGGIPTRPIGLFYR